MTAISLAGPLAGAGGSRLDAGALRLVDFYRDRLSPRKGWHCAAGVAGHETCSTAIRDSIAERGLLASIRPAIAQFRLCSQCARELRAGEVLAMGPGGPGGMGGGPGGGPGGGFGGGPGDGFGGGMGGGPQGWMGGPPPMGPRRWGGARCCCLPW